MSPERLAQGLGRRVFGVLRALVVAIGLAGLASAQGVESTNLLDLLQSSAPDVSAMGADVGPGEGERLGSALEIALLLTVLSLLPGALISLTCFTRIVIVLSFVRRSLGINELPPNPIIIGLALFLTSFVMAPVVTSMVDVAYTPYQAGELEPKEALEAAWGELSKFMLANTRPGELEMFQELAAGRNLDASGSVLADVAGGAGAVPSKTSFSVLVPAFVLSELKTAFQMGFLLFLPFLVIDLVVSSVLLSMGMFMLPPITISTPFKILLFVLVDGWSLVCKSLVTSFAV